MSNPGSIDWFVVTTDDRSFHLSVSAPGQEPWRDSVPWDSIIGVCFEAEPEISDALYVFTRLRPESWVVPADAAGGSQLLDELIRRNLFDAKLAVKAAQAASGLFCWPPAKR